MFLGRISWEATWSLSIRKKVQVDGDEENLKLYATEARQRKRDWSFDGFDRWRFQRLFLNSYDIAPENGWLEDVFFLLDRFFGIAHF